MRPADDDTRSDQANSSSVVMALNNMPVTNPNVVTAATASQPATPVNSGGEA
ncbi:MAG: hypothetical protein U0559_05180 [Anaerolineae bacterium]